MRVVVGGSRTWTDRNRIQRFLRVLSPGTTIIHGGAKGADRIAAEVARELGYQVEEHKPLWNVYGNAAGPIRNGKMLDRNPDYVLAFWDGKSPGTRDLIEQATGRGIRIQIINPEQHP